MMDHIPTIMIDPFYRSVSMTYPPPCYVGSLVQRILAFHGWIDGLDAVYGFDQSVGRYHFSFARECVIQDPCFRWPGWHKIVTRPIPKSG